MFIDTSKSIQPGLGKAPETLDAVDMGFASDEFILGMIHSQVLAINDIDQVIVTPLQHKFIKKNHVLDVDISIW